MVPAAGIAAEHRRAVMSRVVTGEDRIGLGGALLIGATLASGAAALIHQTIWTRAFAIVLGSTVQAASATFAAFLVGLALGAWVFGRRTPPVTRTLQAYVAVELGIALVAPLVGLGIHHNADGLVVWMGGDAAPRVLTSFAIVLSLILVPSALMGATLPLILVAARRLGARLSVMARLYAFNTFGAALGTLLAGFVLIRVVGVGNSLWVAAGLNALSAICFLPLMRLPIREEDDPEPVSTGSLASDALPIPRAMLLGIAASSGLLVLALEIVWTRFASYFLGNRTYAFTTLLACVLVLLAIGSWLSARLYERFETRLRDLFGWTLVVALIASLLSTAGVAWWIEHQRVLESGWPLVGHLLLFYRAAETFALLAPTLVSLGCLFPLSLMAARRAGRPTGQAVGDYNLANTAGAVVGSLGVGFWGVSALGAYGCVAAVALLIGLLALWMFGGSLARERRRSQVSGLAATITGLLLVPWLVPGQLIVVERDEELLFRREDEYGVMQVTRDRSGLIKVTNSRTELVYRLGLALTSYVQQMQGHLGLFFHPDARNALVLGSGYGITAGALAQYPQIESIDAVEIIPGMMEAARLFEPFNLGYHRDPRVHLHIDDGRHFLARSSKRYDIVTINVSDPHLPGGSSLFHAEFYDVVKRHLAEGGVVIQHGFGPDRDIVVRTLLRSFADVRLSRAYGNGWNIVAADRHLSADPDRADALLAVPRVRSALESVGIMWPITPGLVTRAALTRSEIESLLPEGPIATDDRPLLEFAWSGDPSRLLRSND